MVAIVDDDDFKMLSEFSWCSVKRKHTSYVFRTDKITGKQVQMHRQLMNPERGLFVDHINGNALDNRRSNLRVVNCSQNQMNKAKVKNRSSQFKGVSFHIGRKKWLAQIEMNGRPKHLGTFKCETAAAVAYNQAAKKKFGEYAALNFSGRF